MSEVDAHLAAAWLPSIWAVVGVAVVAWATQSSFAWLDLASQADPLARWIRVLGAGCCLGVGVWSAHAIGMSIRPEGALVGDRLDTEVALWLLASGASAAALAGSDRCRKNRSRQWVSVGVAVGSAAVSIQMLGLLPGDWRLVTGWRAPPLAWAWLSSVAGCLLAFGLLHIVQAIEPGPRRRLRVAAGVALGLGAVGAQYFVLVAASLPPQDEGALPGWVFRSGV